MLVPFGPLGTLNIRPPYWWRRRGYAIRHGQLASLSVNRTSRSGSQMWQWRVWRTVDSELLMTGAARNKRSALALAEAYRYTYTARLSDPPQRATGPSGASGPAPASSSS